MLQRSVGRNLSVRLRMPDQTGRSPKDVLLLVTISQGRGGTLTINAPDSILVSGNSQQTQAQKNLCILLFFIAFIASAQKNLCIL